MPVIPDDLNEIFDSIIGAKYAAGVLVIPASAFKVLGAGPISLIADQWSGIGNVECALPFAPGTRIVSIDWGYNRGGAGAVQLNLKQVKPVQAPFATTTTAIKLVNTGTGYTVSAISSADIITAGTVSTLPADTAWSLVYSATDAANIFGGVKIITEIL